MDILRISRHIVNMARTMWRHRVTAAGQVSIPAEVRDRWQASTVVIEDEGDRLVIRPTPDDPVEALTGVFGGGPATVPGDVAVRRLRDADSRASAGKWKRQARRG
jgi:AbrB family looped-hinge helix DNA binding protein